jgi:hypothetical protein
MSPQPSKGAIEAAIRKLGPSPEWEEFYRDLIDEALGAAMPFLYEQFEEEARKALEREADRIEQEGWDSPDFDPTAATVRAVKAQGMRDALAALDSTLPTLEEPLSEVCAHGDHAPCMVPGCTCRCHNPQGLPTLEEGER